MVDLSQNADQNSKIFENLSKVCQNVCYNHNRLKAEYICTHQNCIIDSKCFLCEFCMQAHDESHASLKHLKSIQSIFSKSLLNNAKQIAKQKEAELQKDQIGKEIITSLDKVFNNYQTKIIKSLEESCEKVKINLRCKLDYKFLQLRGIHDCVFNFEKILIDLFSSDRLPDFNLFISTYLKQYNELSERIKENFNGSIKQELTIEEISDTMTRLSSKWDKCIIDIEKSLEAKVNSLEENLIYNKSIQEKVKSIINEFNPKLTIVSSPGISLANSSSQHIISLDEDLPKKILERNNKSKERKVERKKINNNSKIFESMSSDVLDNKILHFDANNSLIAEMECQKPPMNYIKGFFLKNKANIGLNESLNESIEESSIHSDNTDIESLHQSLNPFSNQLDPKYVPSNKKIVRLLDSQERHNNSLPSSKNVVSEFDTIKSPIDKQEHNFEGNLLQQEQQKSNINPIDETSTNTQIQNQQNQNKFKRKGKISKNILPPSSNVNVKQPHFDIPNQNQSFNLNTREFPNNEKFDQSISLPLDPINIPRDTKTLYFDSKMLTPNQNQVNKMNSGTFYTFNPNQSFKTFGERAINPYEVKKHEVIEKNKFNDNLHWDQEPKLFGQQDKIHLYAWLPKPVNNLIHCNLKLIYRASRDGFSATIFHSKCDIYFPTITFIKSNFEKVFGGYTEKTWDHKQGSKEDSNAFIFSLSSHEKFPCTVKSQAVVGDSNYLTVFGVKGDIWITSQSDKIDSHCYYPISYASSKFSYPNPESQAYLCGNADFTVKEMEVYQVVWF